MEIFDKIRQVRFLVDFLLPLIAKGGREDPIQQGKTLLWSWPPHLKKNFFFRVLSELLE